MSTQLPLIMSAHQPLTGWFEGAPPSEGWWNASKYCDPQVRRFYKIGKGWSRPVFVGSDEEPEHLGFLGEDSIEGSRIKYRGLTAPHPDGYSYPLTPVFEEAPL